MGSVVARSDGQARSGCLVLENNLHGAAGDAAVPDMAVQLRQAIALAGPDAVPVGIDDR